MVDMLVLPGNSCFAVSSSPRLPLARLPHGRVGARRPSPPPSAKKPGVADNPRRREPTFPLLPSKPLLARAAVAVFALGFIDAGYSGDWSRIGVISKETEELLKATTYVIIPLCMFLIYSISDEDGTSHEN